MVFQSYALYPHMSVEENMRFALRVGGVPKAECRRRIDAVSRVLRIEALLGRKPRALSGGQRQRVAIGRALVCEPEVFLLDEPLSNLDAELRSATRIELARLHHDLGATMIYVTHDQVEAMTLADRIVVLDAGRVQQFGRPLDLYHAPANRFVAGFIGSPKMNFLDATLVGARDGAAVVALSCGGQVVVDADPGERAPGTPLTLGVRPEHLAVAGRGDIAGTVTVIEQMGAESFLYVAVSEEVTVTARIPGVCGLALEDPVELALSGRDAFLFDGDGVTLPRHAPRAAGSPDAGPISLRAAS
jgi:multiple sugar transport system ATP-binding protein